MRLGLLLLIFLISAECLAAPRPTCVYRREDGSLHQVANEKQVPSKYRGAMRCGMFAGDRRELAQPEDIKLKGAIRVEDLSSPLGRIQLRWPRKVEQLFGRTPERAMSDAGQTVARALRSTGFPPELQRMALNWEVVFMDEDLPTTQIPAYLVSNCHPAWMTPPANIYVVAQRVVAGCSSNSERPSHSVADSQLSQVLIHELGHAVEYFLLKGKGRGDRMRAEGFASWFEQYASDFSSINAKGAAKEFYMGFAKEALVQDPQHFTFGGTIHDYSRASLFFHAIVAKRGVKGLMEVYAHIADTGEPFFDAVKRVIGWNQTQLFQEASKVVQ